MDFRLFSEFNTSVSSEMLFSVMSILHERLPCSQYFFRHRNQFKEKEIAKLSKQHTIDAGVNNNPEDTFLSPIKAIAQPQILKGWSPKVHKSSARKSLNLKVEEE